MGTSGNEEDPRQERRLDSISVEELHGRYTYRLRSGEAESIDSRRLLVLYGDNGTGKTSILRLLFHLLAVGPKRGHRTGIAKTSFRNFTVGFSHGIRIAAERTTADIGPYTLVLYEGPNAVRRVEVQVTDDGSVRDVDNAELDEFYEVIAALGIEPFLVGDDRRLSADSLPFQHWRRGERYIEDDLGRLISTESEDVDTPTAELILTLDRAMQWLRQQALRASNRGSENANAIYTDLLKRFSQSGADRQMAGRSIHESLAKLAELAERNQDYERFGLVPPLKLDPIVDAISTAGPERIAAVQGVLQPFLEVLEARLGAVQGLQESLAAYQDALNSFYWDKRVRISLRSGVEVQSLDGSLIPPASLSSGERQLLMVLTNVLFARDSGALFIIDEPEISLNMKWQRRLVDALLNCTRVSGAQFILATHSFEILSNYRDRVMQLVPSADSSALQLEFGEE